MRTKKIISNAVLVLFALGLSACGALDASQPQEHQAVPGWPVYSQSILDCNTGVIAQDGSLIQPAIGCDSWQQNRYERPFNAAEQDKYYANLDIISADLGSDGQWFFLRITPYDIEEDAFQGQFGLEMDLGMEGRGDYLVLADLSQLGKYWDVLGVKVFADSNDDVGNQVPRQPDLIGEIDGYDLELFHQGSGVDSDLAWARTVDDIRPAIEIAFKTELLGPDPAFKWWVWSDDGVEQPGSFDYHDAIAHEAAGDVYKGQPFFPSNEITALDNTCATIWGAPLTDDPSLCDTSLGTLPGDGSGICLPALSFESWREAFLLSLLAASNDPSSGNQIVLNGSGKEFNGPINDLTILDKSAYMAKAQEVINRSETYLLSIQSDLNEQQSSSDETIQVSTNIPMTEEIFEMWLQIQYREYVEKTDCPIPNECPPHFTFWEFLLWTKMQSGPEQLSEIAGLDEQPGEKIILQHELSESVPDDGQPIFQAVDPVDQQKQGAQKMKALFLLYILYLEELGCEPPGICPPDLSFEEFVNLFTPPTNGNPQENGDDHVAILPVSFDKLQSQVQAEISTELLSLSLESNAPGEQGELSLQDIGVILIVTPDESMTTLQEWWALWLLVNDCVPPDDYPDLECPEPTFSEWKDWLFNKYPQYINTPDSFLIPHYLFFINMLDCDDPEPTPTFTPTPPDEPCVDGFTPEGLPCEPPGDTPCNEENATFAAAPCTPTPTQDPCRDGYTAAGVPCDPGNRDEGGLLPLPTLTPTPTPTREEPREPRDDAGAEPACIPSAAGVPCP